MKKLALYGDGLLCAPEGYGELLVDLLFLRHPAAQLQSYRNGDPELSLEDAVKGVALHVVGKAPHLVLLSVGGADLLRGESPQSVLSALGALLQIILQKTRAQVLVAGLCESFFPAGPLREAAAATQTEYKTLAQTRIHLLDLNPAVEGFLRRHRPGNGEKRALHTGPLRLTAMGRLLLAAAVLEHPLWQELSAPESKEPFSHNP